MTRRCTLCFRGTAGELQQLGWVEPHQYADFGTEFLLYGPRDVDELATVVAIVCEGLAWAAGVD